MLLDKDSLHRSSVVANCRMNRERQLEGSNGYSIELRMDLRAWLMDREIDNPVRWLDVCCGSGLALVEAADLLQEQTPSSDWSIEGIDLAGHFVQHPFAPKLKLAKMPFEEWVATGKYNLVTCIHGLHYIGDKLSAIQKMVGSLSDDGIFVANIDLTNLRFADGRPAGRMATKRLREYGLEYDTRYRLLHCRGYRGNVDLGLSYVGADDQAGPNYTGQPAVDSYYESLPSK